MSAFGGKADEISKKADIGKLCRVCPGAKLAALNYNPHGVVRIDAEHLRDFDQLDDIEPPLTAFVFGNERLRPAELVGDLLLGEAGVLAGLDQPVEWYLIALGVNRFLHCRAFD